MKNKDLKSHQKKSEYEMHLINTLETFVQEVRIPKTEFEKYLAAEMCLSSSAVHNMFQKKQVPNIWSSPNEDNNDITRIKEGFLRAVDKYIKDNPNSKVDIAYWEKYREMYTQGIGYICALINGHSAFEMIEKKGETFDAKVAFSIFMSTDWETQDFTDEKRIRNMLKTVVEYLQTHIDLDKHTVSESERIELAEKLAKTCFQM